MTAVAAAEIGPHTLAEWHEAAQPADGKRLELVAGWWSVSPAPGFTHQRIADRICRALDDQLDGAAVTAVAVDISAPGRYGLIPDVVVVQDEPDGESVPPHLVDLVVEVWSPGNRTFERTVKRDAYANAGVRFLWEVEPAPDGSGWVLIGQQLEHGCWVVLDRLRIVDDVTVNAAPKPITLRA